MLCVGRKVEGFVLEAKRGNQVVEECGTLPGCDEFSASRSCGEARLRIEAGQTGHSSSTTAGFFSHWSASKPGRGSCRGIVSSFYGSDSEFIVVYQAKAGHCNSLNMLQLHVIMLFH